MPAGAQVLVKATVDRDQVLIGEPIQLLLDVRMPLGENLKWFNLDTIPHFEFLTKGKVDTIEGVDGKKIQQQLSITSYDSGHWQIPRLALQVGNKTYYTDTIGITVDYTPFNPDEDYRDIKTIEEVPNPSTSQIPWIIAGITLVAIAGIVYLLQSRKKAALPAVPGVRKLSPYEEAVQSLEALQKKGWKTADVKNYYTQLNDILRIFVLRKLSIASLEKTNEELVQELRKVPMDKEKFQQLTNALQIADFVKFARYQPDTADNERNFKSIQSAIAILNNIT